jgi:3-deoxy-D-manno-octulosonic-acid transferase
MRQRQEVQELLHAQGRRVTQQLESWERIPVPYLLNALYVVVLLVLSPWLLYKSLTTGKYRTGLWRKLTGRTVLRNGSAPCAWFHGVSVGEIHLLRQVIARFRQRFPHWDCVVSTTTDTGFGEAVHCFPDLPICYWPLDFTWAVARALRCVKPTLVVLAEGELWPNFLAAAARRGTPVAQINARMSPRSFGRYRRLAPLARWLFSKVALCAAQTDEYAACFRGLGARRVLVTGSVKYDGVEVNRHNPRSEELRRLFSVKPGELALIAGSTQAPEEQVVLDIFRRARVRHPDLRLFLVPRQKDRFDEVAGLLRRAGQSFVRRSQVSRPVTDPPPVVLVDTIGELGALWGLADVAFVGGSLDGKRGGQNMIEPAAYGGAVIFGPHVWNFKEAVTRLLEAHAALQVAEAAALEVEILRLLGDPTARAALGNAAQCFVASQQGATERTLEALVDLTRPDGVASRAA